MTKTKHKPLKMKTPKQPKQQAPDLEIQKQHILVVDSCYAVEDDKHSLHKKTISERYPAIFTSDLYKLNNPIVDDYTMQSLVHSWADAVVVLVNNDWDITARHAIIAASAATAPVGNQSQPKPVVVVKSTFAENGDTFVNEFTGTLKKRLVDTHAFEVERLFNQKLGLVKIDDKNIKDIKLTSDGFLDNAKVVS